MAIQSNDTSTLTPRTTFDTPTLSFDFPGLLIGIAEYDDGPTGCTVFRFPDGVVTSVDVRGGMVGMTQDFDFCHAICFAGGSLMGLEAVTGVTAGVFAENNYSVGNGMPLVNGAIIYDFNRRKNTIYPDKALGRAALESAKANVFPPGARGAGRNATVGKFFGMDKGENSGQGGAFRQIGDVKVAVFTVVNALGVIINRDGQAVRGNYDAKTRQRESPMTTVEAHLAKQQSDNPPTGNTTLTLVVTNLKLEAEALTQLGRQVHSSMARAIQPIHTAWDGDVLYTVTTYAVESEIGASTLGLIASELAWDAVLSAVGADR